MSASTVEARTKIIKGIEKLVDKSENLDPKDRAVVLRTAAETIASLDSTPATTTG